MLRSSFARLNGRIPSLAAQYTGNVRRRIDPDVKLRNDIKYLGKILGSAIKADDSGVYEAVEKLRMLGREWRQQGLGGDKSKLDEMVNEAKNYDAKTLIGVSRAFSHFLALSNSAENHHRVRSLREWLYENKSSEALASKEDSVLGNLRRLVEEGHPFNVVLDALYKQQVELVLTAHPTEVNRRTMLLKHQHIKKILDAADRPDLLEFEKRQLQSLLRSEISCMWDSDQLKRRKPSPLDEAKGGFAVIENTVWLAVPRFLRKLDDFLKREFKQSLPLSVAPIKIASWMGGDRDGNPNVTPEVTREVAMAARWSAAYLFKEDIVKIRQQLSFQRASPELLEASGNAREPYRAVLKQLEKRLDATMDWSGAAMQHVERKSSLEPLKRTEELLEPLMMLHRSLLQTGQEDSADGQLTDTIRRAHAFGLYLMPLDIRQESNRHTEALSAVTEFLGLGSYSSWDEEKRCAWLSAELTSKRPLLPRGRALESYGFAPTVLDTLRTFELTAELETGSLGAYVISQCQQASDILAVMLLQQDAGVNPLMRVVPLFETLDDLERSSKVVDKLFSLPAYRSRINNKQEIMVGYSDSAKDAGRLAASWAQYVSQEAMSNVAESHGVELTFFHGKGGTVGRGGNPALYQSILSHPPHTINGRFRVTEQGEVITKNMANEGIAERTLDLFTAGVLADRFAKRPAPKKEWREMMERLSASSCAAYRKIVREEPRFVPYFRTATPEMELAGLNVGSRPQKRNPKGGVESLRAIPWQFAWTQTRLNLPAWLGVGDALAKELETNGDLLREMYYEWPWFQTVIDLIEMILAQSEEDVAANYDAQLVTDPASLELGRELRAKLRSTIDAVLLVSGHSVLHENNPRMLKMMSTRNPYVDPLNIIQAELLRRLRAAESSPDGTDKQRRCEVLQDALLITINGIANGLRSSG